MVQIKVAWSTTTFLWLKFQEMYCSQYREYIFQSSLQKP